MPLFCISQGSETHPRGCNSRMIQNITLFQWFCMEAWTTKYILNEEDKSVTCVRSSRAWNSGEFYRERSNLESMKNAAADFPLWRRNSSTSPSWIRGWAMKFVCFTQQRMESVPHWYCQLPKELHNTSSMFRKGSPAWRWNISFVPRLVFLVLCSHPYCLNLL